MKMLTDIHNHSTFSFDGKNTLEDMLAAAQAKGVAFYGVSEHFDTDFFIYGMHKLRPEVKPTDTESYFHRARHLQDDYAGVMNVLVGAELGYCNLSQVHEEYKQMLETYKPDFIVNSVHNLHGEDYYMTTPYYRDGKLRDKDEVLDEYFRLVRDSLDVPYHYDIVGHVGYVTRYIPCEDKTVCLDTHREILTDILQTIIQKDKILEVNAARDELLPQKDILALYYKLGGRKVSYGSDAHVATNIMQRREKAVQMLKEIGFTHISVPCRGEHIAVEL